MGIKMRRRVRLGPVTLHFTQRGFSSWTFKLGPVSRNSRTRAWRIGLPGPWHYQRKRRG